MKSRSNTTKKITELCVLAVFSALAYVSTLYIRVGVSFLTLDIKDSIIIITSLLFGPMSGAVVSVLVPVIELTISDTGIYGLIMNVMSSLTFSFTAGMIYKYKKNIKGAITGLSCGVFVMTAVMMLANLLVTPYFMGVGVSDVAKLIPTLLLPFNLTKGVLNAAIVLFLYKPLSNSFKRIGLIEKKKESEKTPVNKKRSALVMICAAVLIILSVLVIVFVLGGKFIPGK